MLDFNNVYERSNTNSLKWDDTINVFATDDILPMWVADMDFRSPNQVNEAIIKRAEHGIYGYTLIDEDIKENVANWIKNHHDWEIDTNWLTFSPSVIMSLYIAITKFTEENDKILIQTPVYTPFFNVITESNRQIVENPLHFNGDFYEIDFTDLEEKFKQGVKAFIFCSPHNPVGRVWTKDELEKLGNLCVEYDVLLLADEIHADLIFKGYKHIPIASLSEDICKQTITFMSPTKTFNLAGLHISYLIASDEKKRTAIADNLALQGFRMLNTMGVVALDAAYRYGEQWLNELMDVLYDNKQYVISRLKTETNGRLNVIDAQGTYLLWIDFQKLNMSDLQLQHFLINSAKVGLNAGSSYGENGKQFMRINIACPHETLKEGINRIVKAVNNLQTD